MNVFIRFLYALIISAAVVTFIGVGINTFYQSPKYPDYSYSSDSDYKRQTDNYSKKQKSYHRNLTYMLLPLSALCVVGGIYLMRRSEVIGEGLALGGVATSIYAVINAVLSDARILRFLAVTLFLLGTLFVAQLRFAGRKTTAPVPPEALPPYHPVG
jgi:hypothetical protein